MPDPIRLDSFRLGILFPMNSLMTKFCSPIRITWPYPWLR